MAIRRRDGVHYEASGDAVVILDAEGTTLTTLNRVGSLVWRALDGERDLDALTADLLDDFDGVGPEQLRADVGEFLDSLTAAGLVETD